MSTHPNNYSAAVFSEDRRYRYLLRRQTGPGDAVCAFIMLNPSTADEKTDDRTIRRCVGFARLWGYGSLLVANLFALRSTDPSALHTAANPVGPENDAYIGQVATQASLIVAAWGTHGSLYGRGQVVLERLRDYPVHHFGLTAGGQPRHPLYLPSSTTLRLVGTVGSVC